MKGVLPCVSVVILTLLLVGPVAAQWTVTARNIEERSKDGHVVLSVALPVLVGDTNPLARQRINRELGVASQVDRLQRDAIQMIRAHSLALTKKAGDLEEDYSDEHTLEYEVGLNDGRLFSILLQGFWQGGGGAVGNPYTRGCTFDAASGDRLELRDLLTGNWQPAMRALFREYLQIEDASHGCFFDDWTIRADTTDFDFYLTRKGMVIVFPKYSVACGLDGMVSITIPYQRLAPYVTDPSPLQHVIMK